MLEYRMRNGHILTLYENIEGTTRGYLFHVGTVKNYVGIDLNKYKLYNTYFGILNICIL
jgi:hypothetical protein